MIFRTHCKLDWRPQTRWAALATFLLVFASPTVNAQEVDEATAANLKRFPLLDYGICQASMSHASSEFATDHQYVSIGRQLYTTTGWLRSRPEHLALLTCEVDSRLYETLQLSLGVSDNSMQMDPRMTLNLYQGGELLDSYTELQPSQLISESIDLQNPSVANSEDIAIELVCDRTADPYDFCDLYFVEASLVPIEGVDLHESVTTVSQAEEAQAIDVIPPPPVEDEGGVIRDPEEPTLTPSPPQTNDDRFWNGVDNTLDNVQRLMRIFDGFF